jgi:thymidylate synthase (FAD)
MNFRGVPEGQCRVMLINPLPQSLDVLYLASKTCVSGQDMSDMEHNYLWDRLDAGSPEHDSSEKKIDQICKLVKMKHLSVLEHMPLTYTVSNVSRALLAQYSRHRIGVSLSVQSQRYVKIKDTDLPVVIIPSKIINGTAEELTTFQAEVRHLLDTYISLVKTGIAPQDARAILPSCMATQFVTTLNLRSLLDLYEKRVLTSGAQSEIKAMIALFMHQAIISHTWLARVCFELYKERDLDMYQMSDDIRIPALDLAEMLKRKYRA